VMWQGFEARQFPRIHTACSIFIQAVDHSELIKAKTENIGTGGICVILDEPLAKLSTVKIELDLEDGEEPIRCEAKVVWIVEKREFNSNKHLHDTGMVFSHIGREAKVRLECVLKANLSGT